MKTSKKVKVQSETTLKGLKDFTTKSAYIRYLSSTGMDVKGIHKHINTVDGIKIIYQHVRNVLNQPLKRPEVK